MADKDKINKHLVETGLSILEESTKEFKKKLEKERKLRIALESGLMTPAQIKAEDLKIREEILKKAAEKYSERKKKIYANEHPKYRSNYKKD
tara:strand:- start:288 stop:563 length:276 start_codon:yes stop_codon:yes gene_type:complete